MNDTHQYKLPIIYHEIEKSPIYQRAMDGYINATEMCKAAGTRFHNYSGNLQTYRSSGAKASLGSLGLCVFCVLKVRQLGGCMVCLSVFSV